MERYKRRSCLCYSVRHLLTLVNSALYARTKRTYQANPHQKPPTKRADFCITKMTFKIILSGVTGRIGKEVLDQALQNPTITSVIALSRRPLPDFARNGKVKVLLLNDFTDYSDDVVAELVGADGCIW